MNYWQFFDSKVCLTVQDHEWQKAVWEFERVSLTGVHRFQAVKEIGPHQSFSHSERDILLDFYHSNHETLLHLEDDVVFRNLDHLEAALNELPSDWDILYLGANLVQWDNGESAPERHSEHLFRVKSAWTTHAVAYRKPIVKFLLDKQPGFSEIMFDNFMGAQLGEFKAFVVAPMVAWQRPHHSLIWDRYDDYTPIFEQSEEMLK